MRWLAKVKTFVRALFLRRQTEQDLNEELAYHVECEIRNNLRSGMPPDEAKHAAYRLIGSISLYQEECRDARGIGFYETAVRDLRFAFRTLRRAPLFAAAAVLTLALGIGANTTVFTFVDNMLLQSLQANDPERLLELNWGDGSNFSYLNYVDLRDRNTSFSSMFAHRYMPVNLSTHSRNNSRIWGYEASGNYFPTLGVAPLLGRFFGRTDDDQWGAHPVIVISYRLWQTQFSGDKEVVGRAVKVNGFPFTIIGVAPRQFTGTELFIAADYWLPMCMMAQVEPGSEWPRYRGSQNIWVTGRLKPNITAAAAEADLNRILAQIARAYPNDVSNKTLIRLSKPGLLGESLRGPVRGFAMVLLAVSGVGLLLACVNLAGMLLARAAGRQREIGVRIALGASRTQLIRQLLTESLLLALTGGLLGMGLAYLTCRAISLMHLRFDIPFAAALQPDSTVLCFTSILVLATILLFGLVPALQAVRAERRAKFEERTIIQIEEVEPS